MTALANSTRDDVRVGTQEEEAAANGKATECVSGVDNDDDAILLLKALATQDSDVRPRVWTCVATRVTRLIAMLLYGTVPVLTHGIVHAAGARGCQGERGGDHILLRDVTPAVKQPSKGSFCWLLP